jgi:mannose-6-phosphate isomerase-like protein (cupin superfamily)
MTSPRPIPVGVYELLSDFDSKRMSVRIFRLKRGTEYVDRHRHRISTQVYVVLEGEVAILRDGIESVLGPRQALEVLPGVVHAARSMSETAVVMNISTPPLRADDQAPLGAEPHPHDFELPLEGGDLED